MQNVSHPPAVPALARLYSFIDTLRRLIWCEYNCIPFSTTGLVPQRSSPPTATTSPGRNQRHNRRVRIERSLVDGIRARGVWWTRRVRWTIKQEALTIESKAAMSRHCIRSLVFNPIHCCLCSARRYLLEGDLQQVVHIWALVLTFFMHLALGCSW